MSATPTPADRCRGGDMRKRQYRERSDAELLQFLEDCARQTWFLEERRIFEQLQRRLRLVSERVPEPAAETR